MDMFGDGAGGNGQVRSQGKEPGGKDGSGFYKKSGKDCGDYTMQTERDCKVVTGERAARGKEQRRSRGSNGGC